MNNCHFSFFVNDYKCEYSESQTIENDWIDGGIKLNFWGVEQLISMPLLIVEDLIGFSSWLKRTDLGSSPNAIFQFINTELWFDRYSENGEVLLRMNYDSVSNMKLNGRLSISVPTSELSSIINHLEEVSSRFPCRCKFKH